MGLRSWTKKKAKQAYRATKKGVKAAADYGASGAKQGHKVLAEGANRLAGLPEAGLNALGYLPEKKLRIRVMILVAGDEPTPTPDEADQLIAHWSGHVADAGAILGRDAKVRLVAHGDQFVTVVSNPAPAAALNVHCEGKGYIEDYQDAGKYYRRQQARTTVGTIIGTGSPLTAFVVQTVNGLTAKGCSMGPVADYVTLARQASARTLAHEIGHACGLPHPSSVGRVLASRGGNLMTPGSSLKPGETPGENLNTRQVVVFRNSRHVTFL